MNFYIEASFAGSALEATRSFVQEKGGSFKMSQKDNNCSCKLDYFDRSDVSFHMNIYTSCKPGEKSYDLSGGKGSVWSSYLMDQGDKKPKAGNVLTNKNSDG